MPERHTVEFKNLSCNIVSDAERGTVRLQFDRNEARPATINSFLKAFRRRFGSGLPGWINRWRTGATSPLMLASQSHEHPENPDVVCLAATLRDGTRMDSALAVVLDFCVHLPGYQRTYGPPLDRDLPIAPRPQRPGRTASAVTARQVLVALLKQRWRQLNRATYAATQRRGTTESSRKPLD